MGILEPYRTQSERLTAAWEELRRALGYRLPETGRVSLTSALAIPVGQRDGRF